MYRVVTVWIVAPLLISIYLLVGYYPYQFASPDSLDWMDGQAKIQIINSRHYDNGGVILEHSVLRFVSPGIALSNGAETWLTDLIESSTFELLLDLRSGNLDQAGPARIFTISKDPHARNLTIGQSGDDLIVRLRTTATDENGQPEYRIANVFTPSAQALVSLEVSPGQFRLRINGHDSLQDKLPTDALNSWSHDYPVAFGNELTFDRPWQGEVRQAVMKLRGQAVDLVAAQNINIPQLYLQKSKSYINLVPFTNNDQEQVTIISFDSVVNFFGFIPLGVFLAGLRQRNTALWGQCLLCAGLSFAIEMGQIFVPGRFPSTEDFILNTLGGGAGVLLVLAVFKFWPSLMLKR